MRPSPRVRCGACQFAWYGQTAAHGLRLLGACPRCGGELAFLTTEDGTDTFTVGDELRDQSPATVLGTPTSWTRT